MELASRLFRKNHFASCGGRYGVELSEKYKARIVLQTEHGKGYTRITTRDKITVFGTPLGFFANEADFLEACRGRSDGIVLYWNAEQAADAEWKRIQRTERQK
jgi:hypothetical protein